MYLRVEAPHFVAAIVPGEKENRVPPILKYMTNWSVDRIFSYCRAKGWEITQYDSQGEGGEESTELSEREYSEVS